MNAPATIREIGGTEKTEEYTPCNPIPAGLIQRALWNYELYERSRRRNGRAVQHWLKAERVIRKERKLE